MEPSTGIKAWQWIVTAIVIIALIVIGIFVFGGKTDDTTTDTPTGTPTTSVTGVNRIVMTDQYPGNIVNLSSVQFENGGWVVVHRDSTGTPGPVIGQMYFEKGVGPGKITVTPPMIEGGTYYAMLHTDDGDKKFDIAKDLPLKDAAGNVIMKIFRATVAAGMMDK